LQADAELAAKIDFEKRVLECYNQFTVYAILKRFTVIFVFL